MKKTKGKNFIIPLVVYPFDIMVSIGETGEQLKDVLDKYGVDYGVDYDFELRNKARTIQFSDNKTLIRFKEWESTDMGTVAHEIFHAVNFILDRIGMPFDINKNDEAYAYLIGYVTQEFYNRK